MAALLVGCVDDVVIARVGETGVDPCDDAPSSWLLCSGFEEGDLSRWDDADGNPAETNQLVADPGPRSRVGNHVARLSPRPGRGGADLVSELPPTTGAVWVRWHVLYEDGFDFTASSRGTGLHAGDRALLGVSGDRPTGADRFDALFQTSETGAAEITTYSVGMYQDCVSPVGGCYSDHLPCTAGDVFCTRPEDRSSRAVVPTTGRWTCVELLVDPGAATPTAEGADGVLDAWVDGDELGPFTERWLRTDEALVPTVLWLNVFFDGEHTDAGMLIDDVVVATERVGC